MMRRWRNWAFESAALDLALNQAGRALHEAVGPAAPRPCASSTRSAWATRPASTRSAAGSTTTRACASSSTRPPAWTPELIDEVAATGAVEIIDFKGHYGLELRRAARRC